MNFNDYIEYTNLKSPKTKELRGFIKVANESNYYGVCIQSSDIGIAKKYANKDLKIITVGGFPSIRSFKTFKDNSKDKRLPLYLGLYSRNEIDKIKRVIDEGIVDEIDLVFPIYWYTRGHFMKIHKLFKGLKERYKKPIKVIVELGTVFNNYMALYEIISLLKDSNIDYFKTNTGLLSQSFENLYKSIYKTQEIMKDCNIVMPIKASGGIRTEEEAKSLIVNLNVKRIGTSSNLKFNTIKGEIQNEESTRDSSRN